MKAVNSRAIRILSATLGVTFKERQRGGVLLFAMFGIIPVVGLFLFYTLSVESLFMSSAAVQASLDNAALYAYRQMPKVVEAQRAAQYYGKFLASPPIEVLSYVQNGELLLTATVQSQDPIFGLLGGKGKKVELTASRQVGAAKAEVLIILDRGAANDPNFWGKNSPWGDGLDWPAATIFRHRSTEEEKGEEGGRTIERLATQRCQNPIFSPLKTTVIRLYEQLSALESVSVGVMVVPGLLPNVPYDLLRPVQPPYHLLSPNHDLDKKATVPFAEVAAVTLPARSNVAQVEAMASFVNCLRMSQEEEDVEKYFVPPFDESVNSPGALIFKARELRNLLDRGRNGLSAQAGNTLTVRDLIWAYPTANGLPSVAQWMPGVTDAFVNSRSFYEDGRALRKIIIYLSSSANQLANKRKWDPSHMYSYLVDQMAMLRERTTLSMEQVPRSLFLTAQISSLLYQEIDVQELLTEIKEFRVYRPDIGGSVDIIAEDLSTVRVDTLVEDIKARIVLVTMGS